MDLPLSGLPRSSQSLKQSQEKYPNLLALCFCHRAAASSLPFLLPVEYVLYNVFVKSCNWLMLSPCTDESTPASMRRLNCRRWSRVAVRSTLSTVVRVCQSQALAKLRSVEVLCTGVKRYWSKLSIVLHILVLLFHGSSSHSGKIWWIVR